MAVSKSKKLSLNAAYPFGIEHGLDVEIDQIRNMEIEWDRSYTSTLRRGYIVELFERKGIFDQFKTLYWQEGNTAWGDSQRRFYLKILAEYQDFLAGRSGSERSDTDAEYTDSIDDTSNYQAVTDEEKQYFAAEADLRDFLAKNMEVIEPGLRLYTQNGVRGVEYAVDNGRMDLLGIDRDGRFVVIELKLVKAGSRTLGQLLYYMAWVDSHLGQEACRGVIIAREIGDDLMVAVQRVSGVALRRYHLSVSVEQV